MNIKNEPIKLKNKVIGYFTDSYIKDGSLYAICKITNKDFIKYDNLEIKMEV